MADEPYKIEYSQEAAGDLRGLRAYDQAKILDGIERHLCHRPTLVSRTRIKQMAQPFWCQFRLRVEDFRVYYDVDRPQRAVNILRVLKKGEAQTPQGLPHEAD
jgi:mRNA-degrading endonuclease RelE of RelBE toxin-antitoxin system